MNPHSLASLLSSDALKGASLNAVSVTSEFALELARRCVAQAVSEAFGLGWEASQLPEVGADATILIDPDGPATPVSGLLNRFERRPRVSKPSGVILQAQHSFIC